MTDETNPQEVGTADKAKLGLGIAAVAAGVAGYYLLGTSPMWLRWICVVAGFAVAALLLGFSRYGREFRQFVVSARVELRKIVWPNRNDALVTTGVVFAFVAISAVFFWGLDLVLAWATRVFRRAVA